MLQKNHKKNHKKRVLMATVLTMAALLVCCLSMSVFAGTGSNGTPTAPTIKKVENFEILDGQETVISGEQKTVKVGNGVVLTAGNFLPADAYDDYKTVTWESSNTNVATVDENTGSVTAVSPGQVTITATAKNGSEDSNGNAWVNKTVTITVKGLVVSSMTVDGARSTVEGTVYGGEGGNPVTSFNDDAIKDIVEIDSNNQVNIKGAFAVQKDVTLSVCQYSTLNVNSGGTLNVYGTLNVEKGGTLNVYGFLRVYGTLNAQKNSTLNAQKNSTLYVEKGGTLYVEKGGTLYVNETTEFRVSENGTLKPQIQSTYSGKYSWTGT